MGIYDYQRAIYDTMDSVVRQKIESAPYDKTMAGRVMGITGNHYEVDINGQIYRIPFEGAADKKLYDVVKVVAPQNDYDSLFLLGYGGSTPSPGNDGKSAYQIAVDNGFVGTEQEWLSSLEGEKGDTGARGEPGARGEQGLPGKDGVNGISPTISIGTVTTGSPDAPASVVNSGDSTNAVFDFVIPKGDPGEGADGSTGLFYMYVDDNGHLIVRMQDNTGECPFFIRDGHLMCAF